MRSSSTCGVRGFRAETYLLTPAAPARQPAVEAAGCQRVDKVALLRHQLIVDITDGVPLRRGIRHEANAVVEIAVVAVVEADDAQMLEAALGRDRNGETWRAEQRRLRRLRPFKWEP